jgi:hypothetical protein
VIALKGIANNHDIDTSPSKLDFAADLDATATGDANLQAYLSKADELDDNGGGYVSYTSPASGITDGPTRSLVDRVNRSLQSTTRSPR